MSFSSGDLHDKENRVKWYDKKWFMWCMLIFFWPVGAYLLYRHRNEYSPKKAKLIAAGMGCFWLFMSLTSPKGAPQNNQPTKRLQVDINHAAFAIHNKKEKRREPPQTDTCALPRQLRPLLPLILPSRIL